MSDATIAGAEPDIQTRIMATLQPPKEKPEGASQTTPGKPIQTSVDTETEITEDAPVDDGPQLKLSDVALALGVDEHSIDVDDEGVPLFRAKIDGEERLVKVADLLKSYQLEGHLNKQNMEVSEQRKKIEQERKKYLEESSGRLQQMNDTLNLLHANLNAEFQGVDWNALKQHDPNEYVRKRMDFEDKQRQIQTAFTHLNSQRQAQLNEIRTEQMGMLLDKIPDWKDAEKFAVGKLEITAALENYGFPKEEIGQILDHRFFLLAKDAMAYRKLQEQTPAITQKVRSAPKIVKSGQPQAAASKEAALAKLRENIKKGKEGSVSEYLIKRGLAHVKP